MNKTII